MSDVPYSIEGAPHWFGWYLSKPNAIFDFSVSLSPINQAQFDEFRAYTRVVEKLRAYVIDYLALRADAAALADVEAEIGSEMAAFFALGGLDIPTANLTQSRAQRYVSNLLSAASAFKDRACRRLSRDFGKGSPQTILFDARMSQHFDSSFAYRLMSALRNHAQHYENPLSLVRTDMARDDNNTITASIHLELDTVPLVANPRFQKSVKAELESRGCPKLHLTPLARKYMDCLSNCFALVIELHHQALAEMAYYGREMFTALQVPPGAQPAVFVGERSRGTPPRRMIASGFDELEAIFRLHAEIRGVGDAQDGSAA